MSETSERELSYGRYRGGRILGVESSGDSSKVGRRSRRVSKARRQRKQASRPTGVAQEGTIRGQIKTKKRVTVERVRNERVCDFGHAARLYVDLWRKRGERTEKTKKHRGRQLKKGEKKIDRTQRRGRREVNGGGGANEESICSPFVRSFVLSSSARERVPRLAFSVRTRCSLPPRTEKEGERKKEKEKDLNEPRGTGARPACNQQRRRHEGTIGRQR